MDTIHPPARLLRLIAIVGSLALLVFGSVAASGSAIASGSVTPVVQQDSVWATGWCGAIAVRNTTSGQIQPTQTSFTLPAGSTLRSSWNATASTSGRTVTLLLPSWAKVAAGGTYRDTGFCLADSSAPPIGAAIQWRAAGGTPTPTSSPSVPSWDGAATPLSTNGNRIVDSAGQTVILQGVNWFGFETSNHAPHGLWTRDYKDMLAQIASLGFNTVRLPFSLEALRSTNTSGIDYGGGRNAALAGKTPSR